MVSYGDPYAFSIPMGAGIWEGKAISGIQNRNRRCRHANFEDENDARAWQRVLKLLMLEMSMLRLKPYGSA